MAHLRPCWILIALGCGRPSGSGAAPAGGLDTAEPPSPYADCTGTLEYDYLLDRSPDEIIETTWDGAGQVLRVAYDIDGGGTFDDISAWVWRGAERVYGERDADADGLVDETWTWQDGVVVAECHDADADGVDDALTTWTWAGGREERAQVDQGLDGTPDELWSWTWGALATSTTEMVDYDTDADGSADDRGLTVADDRGRTVYESFDRDADGQANIVTTTSWDEEDRRASRTTDYDADGTPEVRFDFFYGTSGRLDHWDMDWDLDGAVDGVGSYTYDCGDPDTAGEP